MTGNSGLAGGFPVLTVALDELNKRRSMNSGGTAGSCTRQDGPQVLSRSK